MSAILFTFESIQTWTTPQVGLLRHDILTGKRYRYDFSNNTLVDVSTNPSATVVKPGFDLLPFYANCYVYTGLFITTSPAIQALLTDGIWIYEPLDNGVPTAVTAMSAVWLSGATDQYAPNTAVIDSAAANLIGTASAGKILVNPANKIATDSSNNVTVAGGGGGGTSSPFPVPTGVVTTGTTTSFAATMTGLGTSLVTGDLAGRRWYATGAGFAGFLTDPCLSCAISGTTATVAFSSPQRQAFPPGAAVVLAGF